MPPSGSSTDSTPLAPSVEKAYYRKCIQLKRRLNEVEAANEEAKIRRLRLDRAIMKMRLERAFLLDELRKRMDINVDGSEGSGEDEMPEPPADRPHRDKKRRQQPTQSSGQPLAASSHASRPDSHTPSGQRTASVGASSGQAALAPDSNRYPHAESSSKDPPLPHGSPYGPPPTGMPSNSTIGASNGSLEDRARSRTGGATEEPTGTGQAVMEENGDRSAIRSTTDIE